MKLNTRSFLMAGALASVALGCIEDNSVPIGIAESAPTGGAKVVFDLDARPLPEIPTPNDVATRIDPTSPTGRRLNVSMIAPTTLESEVRAKANDLDGWGTYAPITVQFDRLLDLHNIVDRHVELVPDFRDDAVFLINIDPKSPEFGELELLDMGLGNFPVLQKDPTKYFEFDPRRNGTNFLFESVQEEDLNGNGVLDPFEDTDDDGVWDEPNILDPGADPLAWRQALEFYERETNTLIIHSVDALEPGTSYAIVLSSALIDSEGKAIDSPFPYINHTRQTPALEVLKDVLPKALPSRFTKDLKNVRFTWSFTTQSSTRELEVVRAGLYGHGTMKWLSEEYPADLKMVHKAQTRDDENSPLIMRLGPTVVRLIITALAGDLSPASQDLMIGGFEDIDYLVSGSFISPYFLADQDGLPSTIEDIANNRRQFDDDEWFQMDLATGEASHGPDEVTWWCTIPKETATHKAPFPVLFYGHGYGSSRVEMLGFAGSHAKFGIATCGLDAAGHGTVIPPDLLPPVFLDILDGKNLANMMDVIQQGRSRDLNNDGQVDSGGDFWTANIFHTRDIVRQSVVDHMQLIRIMRSWDGSKRWSNSIDEADPFIKANRGVVGGWDANHDGTAEIAGDFNGDGVPDIGGEQPYYIWGISLGGILAPLVAGADPTVKAAAPMSGGAGLLEIGHRSTQGGVPEAVILPMLGPLVIGRPDTVFDEGTGAFEFDGALTLEWMITSNNDDVKIPFARLEGLSNKDEILVRNLTRELRPTIIKNKLQARSVIRGGSFRAGLAADAMNANERQNALGFDPWFSVANGLKRQGAPQEGLNANLFRSSSHKLPEVTEVVSNIDLTWAEGDSPDPTFGPQLFARYEGELTVPADGRYTFTVEVNGAVQVYFNGSRRIRESDGEYDVSLTLSAGEVVPVRIDYTKTNPTGRLKLSWENDEDLEKVVVPASAFQTHSALSTEDLAQMEKHTIHNAAEYGDAFVIEIYNEGGIASGEAPKRVVDTFELDAIHDNILYPAGSPLAAIREGFGFDRQSPDMRRFIGLGQHLVDSADPAVYGHKYSLHPLKFPYETEANQSGETNVLFIPTGGDSSVPVVSGYAMARIGGAIDYMNEDPRYGMTQNDWLINNYVYESIYWLDRFPEYPGALFDADDLDHGLFESRRYPERGLDSNPDAAKPLLATVHTSHGVTAVRVPYMDVQGQHGIYLPLSTRGYDIDSFSVNQISHYMSTGGTVLSDDPCMGDYTMAACSWFSRDEPMGAPGPQ